MDVFRLPMPCGDGIDDVYFYDGGAGIRWNWRNRLQTETEVERRGVPVSIPWITSKGRKSYSTYQVHEESSNRFRNGHPSGSFPFRNFQVELF